MSDFGQAYALLALAVLLLAVMTPKRKRGSK